MSAEDLGRRVVIHTDGSCRGNPGPGGWAAILSSYDGERLLKRKAFSGSNAFTTCNRMEMLAAINALKKIKIRDRPVIVKSDSKLLIRGMTEWLPNWKANSWRKSGGGKVENIDLWQEADRLSELHKVGWVWIGRNSDVSNKRADQLARDASAKARAAK